MDTNLDSFDFIVNDEDEVMLLLYERDTDPVTTPRIEFNIEEKTALLYRNDEDILELVDIEDNIIDSLQDADKLLVCELSQETDEDGDNIIKRAYEVDVAL